MALFKKKDIARIKRVMKSSSKPAVERPKPQGAGQTPAGGRPENSVINFKPSRPPGMGKRWGDNVPVAGISHREEAAYSFVRGRKRSLELEYDSANPVDSRAIKVIGNWINEAGQRERDQLGFVPADVAGPMSILPPDKPIAATLEAILLPTKDKKNLGLRINVWGPRVPK